jgi:glycosyltransferase involved in cell wall biosynthesis
MLLQRALAAPVLLASAVVANSEFSREVLASAMPRLRARSVTVPNPVPGPPRVTPARKELTGPVRLLYIGRLSRRKGVHIAVAAVDELRSRRVDAHLQLLGSVFSGYERFEQELRAAVTNRQLDDRVTFLGFRADIWPVVAEADVVVVPSVADEPFGNTAVEAVLSARPVVVSAAGGLCEAVAAYASAQVVPPADHTAIADAVEQVVANWSHYRASASADAVLATNRHALGLYADRLEDLALDLLSDCPETRERVC